MLDLRTQEGRYARDICDGIAADLGGAPNAAQQILCQIFALKALPRFSTARRWFSAEAILSAAKGNGAENPLPLLRVIDPHCAVEHPSRRDDR